MAPSAGVPVLLDVAPAVGETSKFHRSDEKGTATDFGPIPRKPPTPISTPAARPSRLTSTSSISPMRVMSEPIKSTPCSCDRRMLSAGISVRSRPAEGASFD